MNCFRYKIEHDYGFAPNPFHGTLSLAACKGQLRNNRHLQIGDWIFGLGSKSMGNLNHLVFAMKLEEKITFDDYWTDYRFQCKKPDIHGSLLQMYGDNVYHTDPETGKVIQENCAHSQSDGTTNKDHYDRDLSGKYVLLSKTFFYFGDKAPLIPECFNEIYNVGRSIKFKDLSDKSAYTNDFISWIQSNYEIGIHGDPCNWKEFSFPKMNIYED